MNKNIFSIVMVVIAAVAVFLAYTTAQQAVRLQAIDGCVKAGIVKFKNASGNEVAVSDDYAYKECMKKKGLE